MSRELTKEQAFRREFTQIRQDYPDYTRHIKVTDDWAPNYPDGTILGKVTIILNHEYSMNKEPQKPKYIVLINFWGYDDTGMEKWFYVETLEKAVVIYEEQIDYLNKVPENINLKEYLEKDDFRYA